MARNLSFARGRVVRAMSHVDSSVATTLSICTGVGGLDEGLRAGCEYLGFRTVCLGMVERDAYAAHILAQRMEDEAMEPAPVWAGNLEDFPAQGFSGLVDIVSAGFSCQPWSCAGAQKGTEDERWIWPAIVELLRVVGPRMVWLENVPGLISGGGLEYVLSDLASLGFNAEWDCVRASDVGASHRRRRVFILAVADGPRGGRGEAVADSKCSERRPHDDSTGRSKEWRNLKREAAGGFGESGEPLGDAGGLGSAAGATDSARRQEGNAGQLIDRGHALFAPGQSDPAWWRILDAQPWLRPSLTRQEAESLLRERITRKPFLVDASRSDQLRCLGNQCVALQAAVAFTVLLRRVMALKK